ncbi:hypothetical protein DPMN_044746 [Dreissena polymorpha]|uniref:Uncharacterized protein n=1 Tax=Dreissena polymorpha TaxID=45954 RepID=A0A9D4D4P9_DREPO|nr:hypothetical protein DPMN_044746 [Dreissena polymorpha]
MTPTRLIHDVHSTTSPITARSSRPIREPHTISARSINLSSIATRSSHDQIVMVALKSYKAI